MIDLFFDFSNEMLCLADGRGYFTRVNRAWTRTLGWSAEELTNRPYFEFVHPDDLAATQREAALLLSGNHETVRFENRYRCASGSYRWLAWHATLERSSGNLLGAARDVTEQKLQAEAWRESEERFRSLAARAPIGIAQADSEGRISYVNDRWCELAGVTPAQVMGFMWKNFVHADDLAALLEVWQSSLRAGREMPAHEFRVVRADGAVRWASGRVAMLTDADGNVTGQIATVQDISDRKVAEQRFRGVYENAPLGIALIDSQSGRFLHINPKYTEIIGRSEEEMRQLNFQSITHPDDLQDDLDHMGLLRENKIRNFEMQKRLYRGDGSLIWVHLTVVPMWQAGELPVCHLAMVEDITRRKAMEDALKAEQALLRNVIEVQEKEKQHICYEFHDGLIQYAAGTVMLLESYQRTHAAQTEASVIDRAIKTLRTAIHEGRRVIRGIRPTVLDDMGVESAIQDLIDQLDGSGIVVGCNFDPAIPRLPRQFEATIYRVVQEALTNAKKHSGSPQVQIDVRQSDSDIHIEVRDRGCGFDVKAARERGFGLIGMVERVRLIGGECSINSELEAGTRVTARIPLPAEAG